MSTEIYRSFLIYFRLTQISCFLHFFDGRRCGESFRGLKSEMQRWRGKGFQGWNLPGMFSLVCLILLISIFLVIVSLFSLFFSFSSLSMAPLICSDRSRTLFVACVFLFPFFDSFLGFQVDGSVVMGYDFQWAMLLIFFSI